ncbi:unnamed protein product [Paramecium pentaurelia]|uniref:Transmembrane protein n=1 Tax=Paramecium pentaurelia TaxID=43138 RepID=A0A8S1V5S4_9CILI|nr:unnamed protein product [Paramecium pentaurelia]
MLIPIIFLFALAKCQDDVIQQDGIETIQEISPEEQLRQLQEQKLKKERDTIYYTCIILARMHLGNYGSELVEIVDNQASKVEQQNVWIKLYTTHAISCSKQLTYDESVQVLLQVRSEEFDHSRLPVLFSEIDFNQFRNGSWEREISDLENTVWKYIEDFESALAEDSNKKKQQERERDDDYDDLDLEYLKIAAQQTKGKHRTLHDYQPKLQKANFSDILFLILAFLSIGVGIMWIIKKLNTKEEQQKKKKTKQN